MAMIKENRDLKRRYKKSEKRMNKPDCLIFVAKSKQNRMSLIIEEKDLDKFILIGDRVLIRPKNPQGKTASGLYLPPSVQENEKTQSGYIVKVGPGYPIPAMTDVDEPWKEKKEQVQYVPLQAKAGDLAVYLSKSGWEIEFNKEKFIILPHSSILMLIRDEGLFE